MSEKLCLKWNDFQENVRSAFGNLREDNDFADVTLACEDGQQVEAHKVILAASSPFFQSLLARNKHSHPLIYMRGLKSHDLLAIVDFLYCGEANVFQENLDSFLAIAEELQLKGMMGKDLEKSDNFDHNAPFPTAIKTDKKLIKEQTTRVDRILDVKAERAVAIPNIFSGDLDELEERVKALMEKSESNYHNGNYKADMCKVCGKEGKGNAIKDHIEANHLDGIIIPCNICQKTFRSRNSFRKHKGQHQE